MVFPHWALFGLCSAFLGAVQMLLQEKYKVDGFAAAYWNKIICVAVMAPPVIYYGLPPNAPFYIMMAASASMWAISDVVFFRGISTSGAGTVSRILPASVIFSFLLWFAVEPSAFGNYLKAPYIAALIFIVLCSWVYFATHLRKCPVSMKAARAMWFVIFASIIGPLLAKKITNAVDIEQGLYAYTFVQSLMMIIIWTFFLFIRKPITSKILFSRHSCRYGAVLGCISAVSAIVGVLALYSVDNPAYLSAVGYLNSIIILLAYALTGRKNDGNVVAGIGMVICAAALIILKAQI